MSTPDARKKLPQLREEWENCEACELGVRRKTLNGAFVFGEGEPGGLMFIGEGPGQHEEEEGRPFMGDAGKLLRLLLKKMGVDKYYMTNLVACRACAPVLDDAGMPRFRFPRRGSTGPPLPMLRDETPLGVQIDRCHARLYEEIYLVDPVVIVSFGAEAASALAQKRMAITKERGQTFQAQIPGASAVPVLTEKKGAWLRLTKGAVHLPVTQNNVEYLVMPTLHPDYVRRKEEDRGARSPMRQFIGDIWQAVQIYERYLREGFGIEPLFRKVPDDFDYEQEEQEQAT